MSSEYRTISEYSAKCLYLLSRKLGCRCGETALSQERNAFVQQRPKCGIPRGVRPPGPANERPRHLAGKPPRFDLLGGGNRLKPATTMNKSTAQIEQRAVSAGRLWISRGGYESRRYPPR